MDKYTLISLLKRYGYYYNDPAYLSYFDKCLSLKSAPLIKECLTIEKHSIIHDVWSAYLYGDTVKVVYTKIRSNPKKKADYNYSPTVEKNNSIPENRLTSSISRARARVFELASCNEFQYFCTFTVNEKFKDRNNLALIRKDLAQLVRNINRDNPNNDVMKYLFIPEQHKKGGWHLHGLMSGLAPYLTEFSTDDNIPQKLKKMIKNGEKIYDFPRYSSKFGYFTATPIKDKNACSVYLTKYITKDLGKTLLSKGQHLFFASQGLKSREVLAKDCSELPPFFDWDFENDYVKVKTFLLSENTDSKN